MFYSYKKTVKITKTDGTVEETVEETTGPEAQAKVEEVSKSASQEMDNQFKKMDTFFKKMGEAFKELW